MIKKIAVIVILGIIGTPIHLFGKVQKQETTINYKKYIDQIDKFFNSIKTLKADFIEINKYGKQSSGIFALKKHPAMLKMDYINPATKIVIVKNNKLIYYDKELKEKTKTSLYSSPLAFIADSEINLNKSLKVISCAEKDNNLVIAVRKKDDPEEEYGIVVLTFSQKPFSLIKWEIFPKSDLIDTTPLVQLYLQNQVINKNLSDKEFFGYD
ncbi:MAG: outer membrane lipoprotein carrier protein LolA [Alphaproteobacteria bacterium]|nr:outer membrane lipoprotein carrier protein LolA [Alphaproteobacteria bacterium]